MKKVKRKRARKRVPNFPEISGDDLVKKENETMTKEEEKELTFLTSKKARGNSMVFYFWERDRLVELQERQKRIHLNLKQNLK